MPHNNQSALSICQLNEGKFDFMKKIYFSLNKEVGGPEGGGQTQKGEKPTSLANSVINSFWNQTMRKYIFFLKKFIISGYKYLALTGIYREHFTGYFKGYLNMFRLKALWQSRGLKLKLTQGPHSTPRKFLQGRIEKAIFFIYFYWYKLLCIVNNVKSDLIFL